IAIADLMHAAGLTHGGFYNHFSSKDELEAEACALAFDRAIERLVRACPDASGFANYVERYLDRASRDAPGPRCPMAALSTDAARQGPVVRGAFAEGMKR